MKIDITQEIVCKSARSGGKGGQNVNKVETMVEGRWNIDASRLLTAEQNELVKQKLYNRITAEGELLVKSQADRTQLGNKQKVIEKINQLVEQALQKKKARIATKPSKQSKAKRLEGKKQLSEIKQGRKKFRPSDF